MYLYTMKGIRASVELNDKLHLQNFATKLIYANNNDQARKRNHFRYINWRPIEASKVLRVQISFIITNRAEVWQSKVYFAHSFWIMSFSFLFLFFSYIVLWLCRLTSTHLDLLAFRSFVSDCKHFGELMRFHFWWTQNNSVDISTRIQGMWFIALY